MDPSLVSKLWAFAAALFLGAMAALAFFASKEKKAETPNRAKMAGLIVGAVVTGLMGLTFAWKAWNANSIVLPEPAKDQGPTTAIGTASEITANAAAALGAPPDPSEVAKGALAGEDPAILMEKAKAIEAAGQEAVAKAKTGVEAAATASLQANSEAEAARQKVTEATVNAAAKKAAAEQAEQTLGALTSAANKAKEVANNTRGKATLAEVSARETKVAGNALAARGAKLRQVIPLAAAAGATK